MGSLLLLASNWVIPMSLLNIMRAAEKLNLPENILIFRVLDFSLRGNQADFISFIRMAMLFCFTVCVGASVYSVAYWKQRFTAMVKSSMKLRNNRVLS
jgi:hypothetical protein